MPKEYFNKYLSQNKIFEKQKIMVIDDIDFIKNILINLLKSLTEKNKIYFNSYDEIFSYLISISPSFNKLYELLEIEEKENILNEICNISINKNLEKEIVLDIR